MGVAEGSVAWEEFIRRISCMGIMLSASLLACSLSLSSIAGGPTGSSMTSIFKEETSVNASEYESICLYHLMAPVSSDARLHAQGFPYSSVWNVIAPAFHEFELSQDSLYRVASEWLQNECSSAGLGSRNKSLSQFAPLLALLAFALLNRGFRIYDSESEPKIFFNGNPECCEFKIHS
jgi:hypothetical protein